MEPVAEVDRKIHNFVLTGGPCGGKSTGLCYLEEKLRNLGYAVLLIPETPTELMRAGIKPGINGFSVSAFQEVVFKRQLETENIFREAARASEKQKIIILQDRGLADQRAYTDPDHFLAMAIRHGFDGIPEVRDTRYEGIYHLRTAALGAEKFYTTDNNPARVEKTIGEAIPVDEATLNAWIGHPHLRVIDNSTDFEGKMKRLFQELCASLGIPVPIERERKFLIEPRFDPRTLSAHVHVQKIKITQAYLLSTDNTEHRIRARGQDGSFVYYKTKKAILPDPETRLETEEHITKAIFEDLWDYHRDPTRFPITKLRYCFIWNNQYFELDYFQYPGRLGGLCILEIELTHENTRIDLPPFLHIEREVTGDKRYSNRELAKRH